MAADSCIDSRELTAAGRILLIDLGKPPEGLVSLQRFQSNLWSRFFLSGLSLDRPSPWAGSQRMLVIDEAHIVAPLLADELEVAVTTLRSYGGAVCLMTQTVALLRAASPTLLPVLLGNTAVRFSGRLAASDAEALVRELGKVPGVEEPLARVRSRIASELISLPDRQFMKFEPGGRQQFTSNEVDLSAWSAAAEEHAGTISAIRSAGFGTLPDGPRPTLAEVVALRNAPDPTSSRDSRSGDRSDPGPSTPWIEDNGEGKEAGTTHSAIWRRNLATAWCAPLWSLASCVPCSAHWSRWCSAALAEKSVRSHPLSELSDEHRDEERPRVRLRVPGLG